MNKGLKIGEVAVRAGLQVSAIRYYERLGLLPVAQRVNTHRLYDISVLQRLEFIRTAQRVGFTLLEVGMLLNQFETGSEPAMFCHELVQQKLLEIESLITQAHGIKHILKQSLYCQCRTLQQCTHTLTVVPQSEMSD